ncbi:universal stress protein UspA [Candidatus Methanomassiliicoccus intestinalis]|uniref:Universal stress protein n=1 Tax=Methanomassiliicoccus intestinalis (strain Issoire-Mx1) TaxID=1295009 RepID=R9TAH0_METII|nr:universal stress protein [Candidatus Methanomassiliicoccus intestinalis]AGN26393.1 universal stress protein [Candidatus Methanomassiliicoccus intestinalis Issoire-Mx1]TQS82413.1 MAG: universal stress protein UspA [Candidatus Methanomassiliicoccus intestinalis]
MSQFTKILIPTDGSENTLPAITTGLALAKQMNAEVTALYVVDQTAFVNFSMDSTIVSIFSLLEKEGKAAVSYIESEGEKLGVKVTSKILEGSPSKKIIEEAKENDLIVMGTLGRSGISKLLLGSVAERVVRYSPCPVLIIRSPQEKEDADDKN